MKPTAICTALALLWSLNAAGPALAAKSEDRVRIFSDTAIYKREEKQALAKGKVRIVQGDTTIFADEAVYFEDSKQSFIDEGVKVVQVNPKAGNRQSVITAQKMTAFHEEKRILFEQSVRLDREADPTAKTPETYVEGKPEKRKRTEAALKKERSVITADEMEYFTKSENANLRGNVVVLQKEKKVTGDKGFIKGKDEGNTITIEGHARVTQIRGDWLIREKIIKPDPEDEEQERFLKEKLVMEADRIVIYQDTDDMDALGNVKVTQKVGGKERVAVGEKAFYRDKEQTATLLGNVKIQRENADWLTADKAIFYTEKEDFEAIGTAQEQVISEFTIEDEDNKPPKEPINPPSPEFDLDQHSPGPVLPSWLGGQGEQNKPAHPAPTPTPQPSVPPAGSPTPQASPPKPAASPKPIESSFIIKPQ